MAINGWIGLTGLMVLLASCADGAPRGSTGGGPPPEEDCAPGTRVCADGVARTCGGDGKWTEYACDPVQGMACAPDGCTGACTPHELASSYVGCDYWPTVTANPVWSEFHFGVAIASAVDRPAHVTVTRGDAVIAERTVAAGGLEVIQLPWVAELKGDDFSIAGIAPDPGPSRAVVDGAYRLRSDRPVIVYQFSPLEFTLGAISDECPGVGHGLGCNSYSNDASLLLPAHTMGTQYGVATWPATSGGASMVAITATQDGTEVILTGAGEIVPGGGIDAAGNGSVVLDAGDVLEVLTSLAPGPTRFAEEWRFGSDLTGMRVVASRPIQVIAGHSCANVPDPTTGYCDHIEEAMLPDDMLGDEYVVTTSAPPVAGMLDTQVVRVTGVRENTRVRFEPPLIDEITLDATRRFVELRDVSEDLRVIADAPVIVSHYQQGTTSLGGSSSEPQGDPAFALAVPTRQYRSDYVFYASDTYTTNWVNVVAPAGIQPILDGRTLTTPTTTLGDHDIHRVELDVRASHHLSAAAPVGILVYGYGSWTSYMYPGGLDLVQGPF